MVTQRVTERSAIPARRRPVRHAVIWSVEARPHEPSQPTSAPPSWSTLRRSATPCWVLLCKLRPKGTNQWRPVEFELSHVVVHGHDMDRLAENHNPRVTPRDTEPAGKS